ncbi:MAG: VOC family protein [Solirubrobacterales bacterium]|nr:VOC family protein [Solirubrobacterales bacterium]
MRLIHTCYRVLDLERSKTFYAALGFEEIGRIPIGTEATNLFMNLPGDGDEPRLELTFNHDRTEPYDIGDGFGHIALAVDDLDATLERLSGLGIEPEREPYTIREGGTRLCFVGDPDGYRIELLGRS